MRIAALVLAVVASCSASATAQPSKDYRWTAGEGVLGVNAATDEWFDMLTDNGRSAVGLNAVCRATVPAHRDACDSVIAAVMSVHYALVANRPELAAYCPSRQPSIDEARGAFLRWWDRMRAVRGNVGHSIALANMPEGVAVLAALRDEMPCTR
jgi:hypothetical protein